MSTAEKAALPDPKLPKKPPTNEMFESWKTQPDVYAVWIDGKYINNADLKKYKPDDFPLYGIRKPGKIDLLVNENYGKFSFLVNLSTKARYQERYIRPYNKPGKWLGVYNGEIWPRFSDGAGEINRYFEYEKLKAANPQKELMWVLPPFKPEKI